MALSKQEILFPVQSRQNPCLQGMADVPGKSSPFRIHTMRLYFSSFMVFMFSSFFLFFFILYVFYSHLSSLFWKKNIKIFFNLFSPLSHIFKKNEFFHKKKMEPLDLSPCLQFSWRAELWDRWYYDHTLISAKFAGREPAYCSHSLKPCELQPREREQENKKSQKNTPQVKNYFQLQFCILYSKKVI